MHDSHSKTLDSLPRPLAGILALVCIAGTQQACRTDAPDEAETEEHAGEVHWGYEGDAGPGGWGSLDPSFAICDGGMRQSPVDLAGAESGGEGGLEVEWQATDAQVSDNGHTVQVDLADGGTITLDGRRFSLLQFHFHLPSEHTVDGESFPMEVHFVHGAEEGDLAVIGVFMDAGDTHPAIQNIWDAIPGAGQAPATSAGLDPRALLPEGRAHFRYAGSLTTPPCSEVVSWVAMTESISVSQAQVDAFAALHPMNARPLQPLHERSIELRR